MKKRTLLCPKCGDHVRIRERIVRHGSLVLEIGPRSGQVEDAYIADDYETVNDDQYMAEIYCSYCDWTRRLLPGECLPDVVNEALALGSGFDTL